MDKKAKRKLGIALVILSIALLPCISLAQGNVDWTLPANNLSSGYRVTTENFPNPVNLGDTVVAWAATNNTDITEVKFRWLPPSGSGVDPIVHPVTTYITQVIDGNPIRLFTDSYAPSDPAAAGDWGIQALFYDSGGHGVGPIPEQPAPVRIIARSFELNTIPEVPLGIVTALVAMLVAFGVFHWRRTSRHQ